MFTQQVLSLPHFLEDQYVWLSIGTWAVLLIWLRHRASRRRVLMWAGLAGALHLTPVAAQVIRGNAAINVMAHDMPLAFWTLQAVNLVVLTAVVGIGYFSLRRVAQGRQWRAVMAERRRIANDLHDGVGSRLVALLASQDPKAARSDGLSMALQACLLELQMTVDDLDDQTHATVLERLGHLRYRLRPAFERMGITLDWNIAPDALECTVRPDTATQVCRVVQEALSNALRHSRATRVELRVSPQDRARSLVLEVRDNGRGLDTPAGAPGSLGKGLRSMRSRADAIGGELAVMDLDPHGLCVRLVVPCQASSSEPHSVLPEAESML
ncbi:MULTISPECIES: sensor histidine kinase [unclassified Variovorax]|uniref:sensor histidine kinase n=1 Tax=unclassified Variovorax TaxID=663243 RepID=UPI003F47D55E